MMGQEKGRDLSIKIVSVFHCFLTPIKEEVMLIIEYLANKKMILILFSLPDIQ